MVFLFHKFLIAAEKHLQSETFTSMTDQNLLLLKWMANSEFAQKYNWTSVLVFFKTDLENDVNRQFSDGAVYHNFYFRPIQHSL